VEYLITDAIFIDLLETWLEIFENDERIRDAFESLNLIGGIGSSAYREMISELRNAIRELNRELSGEVVLAFYIGSRDRLLRVDLDGNVRMSGDRVQFNLTLDLGSSATDVWALRGSLTDRWGESEFEAVWDTRMQGNRHIHTIDISTASDGRSGDTLTLTSEWNHQNGDFIFLLAETGRWGSWEEELLNGNFRVDGDTFRLRFEHSDHWGSGFQEFSIEVSTEAGSFIRHVDFINIDEWGSSLIDSVTRAFFNLMF
jgi:hypothetical protein